MRFCPDCRAEFLGDMPDPPDICPDCDVALVAEAPQEGDRSALVDSYICYDEQLADRVVTLLTEQGVDALVRDRSSHAFPTTVGKTNSRIIAVPGQQLERARELLRAAIIDEVIPEDSGELR